MQLTALHSFFNSRNNYKINQIVSKNKHQALCCVEICDYWAWWAFCVHGLHMFLYITPLLIDKWPRWTNTASAHFCASQTHLWWLWWVQWNIYTGGAYREYLPNPLMWEEFSCNYEFWNIQGHQENNQRCVSGQTPCQGGRGGAGHWKPGRRKYRKKRPTERGKHSSVFT